MEFSGFFKKGETMRKTSLSSVLCLLSFSLLVASARAEEWGFSYSGRLMEKTDGTQVVVGAGMCFVTNFYVRLYIDADGASTNVVWSKMIEKVPVNDGNFSFEVSGRDENGDTVSAAFAALTRSQESRLTIGVTPFGRNQTEITPRQELVTVPSAAFAGDALGMRGDATLEGCLTAGTVFVPTAAFRQGATHAGVVTFEEPVTLPSLTLPGDKSFSAKTIVATNALSAASLSTRTFRVRQAKAQLVSASSLSVGTDLAVKGAVKTPALVANESGTVTLARDVSAGTIEAAQIELNGSVNLFDFHQNIASLIYGTSEGQGRWWKDSESYVWKAPYDLDRGYTHNVFVSLSLCVPAGGKVLVSVGGQLAATLEISGVSGRTWLPFQTFLKPGEEIRWQGGGEWSENKGGYVLLTYREVGF